MCLIFPDLFAAVQLGEGADLSKKLLERGAGGMGLAGSKVSDALSTVTDKATEASHKLAELIKAPFQRHYARADSGPRLHHESSRVDGDWEDESAPKSGPIRREAASADAEEEPSTDARPIRSRAHSTDDSTGPKKAREDVIDATERAERRKAQQRATQAERDAKRAARTLERTVNRVNRHAHGMRMDAFEQQVPASGIVQHPVGHGMTYSQAKRAALKASQKAAGAVPTTGAVPDSSKVHHMTYTEAYKAALQASGAVASRKLKVQHSKQTKATPVSP
jgi:hypothetical protein